jgi:MFS family permease
MNVFGFSYSALIAPIGLDRYGVSPALVGALAAAEPIGAIASGIALSAGWLRLDGGRALLRGSLLFLVAVVAMALSPWYGLAFALLLTGGLGTAAFSNMQTTLILTEAPAAMRSRVMGIVTMCIGTGPLGVLAIGLMSEALGSPVAILTMAGLGADEARRSSCVDARSGEFALWGWAGPDRRREQRVSIPEPDERNERQSAGGQPGGR